MSGAFETASLSMNIQSTSLLSTYSLSSKLSIETICRMFLYVWFFIESLHLLNPLGLPEVLVIMFINGVLLILLIFVLISFFDMIGDFLIISFCYIKYLY